MSVANLNKNTIIKLCLTFGVPIIILLFPTTEIFTAQMRMAIAATAMLLIWSACRAYGSGCTINFMDSDSGVYEHGR